ncbi:MAG: hypothetical protein EPN91_02045 [Salinibacterium sp.]|nr:MAG: hypothetical protein EPN91_02045 [Salinibacterium sp.]
MFRIGLKSRQAQIQLENLEKRIKEHEPALAEIGAQLALVAIPQSIMDNVGAWRAPSGYPRSYRLGGTALVHTRRMIDSVSYHVVARKLTISTAVPYGNILNSDTPTSITPKKGQWLLWPVSPPLTEDECKNFPVGKEAIKAQYPGSWFGRGPGGFGVHRGGDAQLIAMAAASAVLPAFHWLWWRPDYIALAKSILKLHMQGKLIASSPLSGGVPDVGKR